jgi:hypothetical protein
VIAATPPSAKEWGIYENGCRNGLVVSGGAACEVSVSVDAGQSWSEPTTLAGRLDLTDAVKGRRGYWLRIGAGAEALKDSGLAIRTVCQANPAVLPRLKDGGTLVRHASSGQATWSAGPERPHAQAHVVAGAFDSPAVTLKVRAPRGGKLAAIHAAAHIASGNPPSTNIVYRIDASLDAGASWRPVVSDWRIARRGEEPKDFWSQSFCYGSADIPGSATEALVRFSNSGSRAILRAEAHAIFQTGEQDPARVEYCWTDDAGEHRAAHVFDRADSSAWRVPSGREVRTRWVEIQPLGRR